MNICAGADAGCSQLTGTLLTNLSVGCFTFPAVTISDA